MTTISLPPRVLVVGLARSGQAAARLAADGGAEVWVTDRRAATELGEVLPALPPHTRTFLGGHPEACLDGVGLVITSPGVLADAPVLAAARERGIAVVTEVEFAWRHRPDTPLVAVTGSNGKSTVTVLTAEMLKTAGIAAAAGGNLGPPASELVLQGGFDTWVLEVSSFQTELLTAMRPRVAVFLNLSQDHLERHPTLADYLTAKRRLFAFQGENDAAVLNADDPEVLATPTRGRRLEFSLARPADGWLDGEVLRVAGEALSEVSGLALAGRHNLANALAASLAAGELGVPAAAAALTLVTFHGLPHRHRTVFESGGVRWVDDSKATNVGATVAALGGYSDGSVHLILGGQAKGQDFGLLADEAARTVACLYLIGVDAPHLAAALGGVAPIEHCGTLEEAVRRARRAARPGQTVLLAPACASFDQFTGYAERGDTFARLAKGGED